MEPDIVMTHKSECCEPAYDDRPTITFKEVWGNHSWKVEYHGKYDNKERQPHVKLRFDYDAPDQHIYKVRQEDVYSLHNLRKGGKDNKAVLWDVQGLMLSNGKEAHFTVHHGQRHEKEFLSTRQECLQAKSEELKKRLMNSGISKTAKKKQQKKKQTRPRKNVGRRKKHMRKKNNNTQYNAKTRQNYENDTTNIWLRKKINNRNKED